MLIQGLLDFGSLWIAGLLDLVPLLPEAVASALGWITDAGNAIAPTLGKLSPIFPWLIFQQVVSAWLSALTFWGAMLVLRVALWAIGR